MISLLRPFPRRHLYTGVFLGKLVVFTTTHCVDLDEFNSVTFPLLSLVRSLSLVMKTVRCKVIGKHCRHLPLFCNLHLVTKPHKQLKLLFLQERYLITASPVFPQMQETCGTTIHANFTTATEGFDVTLPKLATSSNITPVNLL